MKIERAIQLLDQQKKIPHPIDPDNVTIIKGLICYEDITGCSWVLIRQGGKSLLIFKPDYDNRFYFVD